MTATTLQPTNVKLRIPLRDLAIPGGKIAVLIKVHGTRPFIAGLNAENITEVVGVAERAQGFSAADRDKSAAHGRMAGAIVTTVKEHEHTDDMVFGCASAALWCTINHPSESPELRSALRHHIRAGRTPIITFETFDRGQYAIAVSQDAAPEDDAMLKASSNPRTATEEAARSWRPARTH